MGPQTRSNNYGMRPSAVAAAAASSSSSSSSGFNSRQPTSRQLRPNRVELSTRMDRSAYQLLISILIADDEGESWLARCLPHLLASRSARCLVCARLELAPNLNARHSNSSTVRRTATRDREQSSLDLSYWIEIRRSNARTLLSDLSCADLSPF